MSNQEILTKAIDKANKNGWLWNCKNQEQFPDHEWLASYLLIGKNGEYQAIFDHDFAKAFWGDQIQDSTGLLLPAWQYHLQQMVLETNPIEYLAKFL